MIPYLHVLVKVEDDGSLRALSAFTDKARQERYREDAGLEPSEVRLDFYNGPFPDNLEVVYVGHREWNMDRYQLAGYFRTEGEAWTEVTQDGYVSLLRIDTSFAEEQELRKKALQRYAELQRKWSLVSYDDLTNKQGSEKTNADIVLRFYEDALESLRPKTRRDVRALYVLAAIVMMMPIAIFYVLNDRPKFGENVNSVGWLPDAASDVSYYKSRQIKVYEFKIPLEDFKALAIAEAMQLRPIEESEAISRYKAYLPQKHSDQENIDPQKVNITEEMFENWQRLVCVRLDSGWIAENEAGGVMAYDMRTGTAYYEELN